MLYALFWLVFVFLASLKSGNDFLYPHYVRSTYLWTGEKMKIFIFFLKIFILFWKFKNFQRKTKFPIFLLFTDMCYGHDEDIKSHFLTSEKPKKQNKVKIMHITSWKWRSKMPKNCIFFYFFSKPIAKIDTRAWQNANFCYHNKKKQKLWKL